MQYSYLAALVFSCLGMGVLDRRYSLALFYNSRRTLATIGVGVVIFTIWDIAGIALGIFFSGQTQYLSGLYLGPEYPLEELIFLTFLCYFTLVMYRLGEKKWRPM